MKSRLKEQDIEIYSVYNEGKSMAAERIIRTLKDKIYKYMTSVSKTLYIDKLDDIIAPNWYEEVFVIEKVKNIVPCKYAISNLKKEEIVGTFYENHLQKRIRKILKLKKVIKRKFDNLYVKWKG